MFLVPFEHISTFVFPLTSELWLWQKSCSLHVPINFHCPRPPFRVFNLGTSFLGQAAFLGFQLDLFLFFFWFKPSFRVFTLNLFFSFFSILFSLFLHLSEPPFRVFNFDKSFLLVASSIILLDYVGINRIGELFSIHFCKYQGSSWECLFHDISVGSFGIG